MGLLESVPPKEVVADPRGLARPGHLGGGLGSGLSAESWPCRPPRPNLPTGLPAACPTPASECPQSSLYCPPQTPKSAEAQIYWVLVLQMPAHIHVLACLLPQCCRSTLWHFGDISGLVQATCTSLSGPLDWALSLQHMHQYQS